MSYIVTAPLVLVRDGNGRHAHAYQGTVIEHLVPEQATRLLDLGFVEEIAAAQVIAIADAQARREQQVAETEAEPVARCVAVLTELDLPLIAGRPSVRAALEAHGHKFSNETIAAAIRERRELSRTPGLPASPLMAEGQIS
jgi:hypothetical protein